MNDAPAKAPVNPYLKTKVLTASPEELRLMLYDGAIKFSRQALDAIGKHDWEGMYNALIRTQKIVLELSSSLKHEHEPDLCSKLAALYMFIYRRLVDANLERDPSPVQECIQLLEHERETWVMVMKRLNDERNGTAPARPAPAPTPTPPSGEPIGRIGPEGATYSPTDDGAPRSNISLQG